MTRRTARNLDIVIFGLQQSEVMYRADDEFIEMYRCKCGGMFRRGSLRQHLRTKRHTNLYSTPAIAKECHSLIEMFGSQ